MLPDRFSDFGESQAKGWWAEVEDASLSRDVTVSSTAGCAASLLARQRNDATSWLAITYSYLTIFVFIYYQFFLTMIQWVKVNNRDAIHDFISKYRLLPPFFYKKHRYLPPFPQGVR